MSIRHRSLLVVALALLLSSALASSVAAQDPKSAPVAKDLVQQLERGKLQFIAARVVDEPGRYVAALYIPNVQLLVVSALYKEPAYLDGLLVKKQYQDLYTDLNSAAQSQRESKIFVEDLRANGLFPRRDGDEPFDLYESAGRRVMFDGDSRKQKLSDKEYADIYASADERYTKLLTLLLAEAKKGGS